jgi:Ca2+-binding RTX toxin-like protein
VILRQLSQPGTGTACCFFVTETPPMQPQPNTVTTFQTNLPVERSTDVVRQIVTADFIGLSAASGTGTLPIATTGRNNLFDFTQPGSVNAGAFYPRLGAIPNDSGGGRHEAGIPGFEVLMQWTFTPAGAAPGGAGGAGGGAGGGGQGGAGVTAATAGDDTITGTAAADRICGLAGSDTIDAAAGDDTVFGDACDVKARALAGAAANGGNDTLSGSDGNDTLYGAGGNDNLNGGQGNDKLFGGSGTNSYVAGAGNDKVSARNGKREKIDCGPGRDTATIDKNDTVKGCEKVNRARK